MVIPELMGSFQADRYKSAQAAIQALLSSGLRAVYCYTPPLKLKSREPWKTESAASDETFADYQTLARGGPYGDDRVHIGYANDDLFSPAEVLQPLYAKLRDPAQGRAKVITTHTVGGHMQGESAPTAVQILDGHGLLGPDVLLSHANWPREGDGERYARSGAHVSSTPNTELQMGRAAVALREDHYDRASIGVDCHTATISEGKLPFWVILAPKRAVSGGKPSPGGGPMRAFWRDPLILEGVSRASVSLSATKAGV
jgi:cytosine/adenosine deaminase-related metal-dependent hydrolase